ncbi:uncharacterized protein BT62DRAFT_1001201 [Guyanagaster necrorhizus]|uniref:DUF7726 domain-containing protein n=1 Tax=Guyanagaster necrorhizus TaxID=856835 RepID=A0A9P8AWI2_9AGAR|nr:uncharacterized protein BT62DRAFT_1001201 [Guyanagaster necrorhizus MCA 3950]KAG7450365.1 hypothetical protein BT62DRAFT_1001201 [Guyanagaster necrorhizus MCA 3950]
MGPKRKSDAIELEGFQSDASSVKENDATYESVSKKGRTSEASERASSSSKGKDKAKNSKELVRRLWRVFWSSPARLASFLLSDDCAEIRRKIAGDVGVTQWLKDIGGINSNSYSRFNVFSTVKEKGKTGGASNGTYYAACVYFEKVCIAEGKKKTPARIRHEAELPRGYPLERSRGVWVIIGR